MNIDAFKLHIAANEVVKAAEEMDVSSVPASDFLILSASIQSMLCQCAILNELQIANATLKQIAENTTPKVWVGGPK